MINLAGNKDCDNYILQELATAGIATRRVPLGNTEVPYTIEGRLGLFRLWRSWYYWVVKGLIPLPMAEELYADPIGKGDVRCAGHCACPEPLTQANWYLPDGREVLTMNNKTECEEIVAKSKSNSLIGIAVKILRENNFAEDPSKVEGVKGYVTDYHIDSQEGLNLFVAAFNKHSKLFLSKEYDNALKRYVEKGH